MQSSNVQQLFSVYLVSLAILSILCFLCALLYVPIICALLMILMRYVHSTKIYFTYNLEANFIYLQYLCMYFVNCLCVCLLIRLLVNLVAVLCQWTVISYCAFWKSFMYYFIFSSVYFIWLFYITTQQIEMMYYNSLFCIDMKPPIRKGIFSLSLIHI